MTANMKQIEQFRFFNAELNDLISESDEKISKSWALIEIFKTSLVENGETEEDLTLVSHEDTTGRNRTKFDAVCFNNPMARIDLIVTLITEESEIYVNWSKVEDLARKAGRVFRLARNQDFSRFNNEAKEVVEKISAEMPTYSSGRIIILTNGFIKNPTFFEDTDSIENFVVSFRVFDKVRFDRLNQQTGSLDDIKIEFKNYIGRNLPCVEEKIQNKDYDTYLAILSGDLIYQLFEKYGPKLYEFNVRSFLQARGKVNQGIRRTIQNEPDKFLAFNNGLVATVESLEIESEHGVPFIKSVTGLQIVNGAQTTASIHRAKKVDKFEVTNISVAAKITHIRNNSDKDFISNISLFANSQNNIQMADLSANHPLHVEIERLAEVNWCPGKQIRWFYERARGSYQMAQYEAGSTKTSKIKFKKECPPNQVFKKPDLAKVFHAWQMLPHVVGQGAQKNFNIFMQELKESGPEHWQPSQDYFKKLMALIILYKMTEKIIRSKNFPAYRANIAAYTVSYVSYHSDSNLDFELIWNEQTISRQFQTSIEHLTKGIDSALRNAAGALNVTEYAKKEACWNEVKEKELGFKTDTIPEFGSKDIISFDHANGTNEALISWCKSLDIETLAAMLYHGHTTERLQDIEIRVISTVLSYAKGNWQKEPSIKQANRIKAAYRICEEDQIF